jgi:hypothetical protein
MPCSMSIAPWSALKDSQAGQSIPETYLQSKSGKLSKTHSEQSPIASHSTFSEEDTEDTKPVKMYEIYVKPSLA